MYFRQWEEHDKAKRDNGSISARIHDVTDDTSDNCSERIEKILSEEIEFELSSFLTVIKCSVHTLQLAVYDAMQKLNLG